MKGFAFCLCFSKTDLKLSTRAMGPIKLLSTCILIFDGRHNWKQKTEPFHLQVRGESNGSNGSNDIMK